MLFVLSHELLPFCSKQKGAELEGLQNLLLCARQGIHALTGPKPLFLALCKNEALAARERATALNLVNRMAELPILEAAVKHKIYVKANAVNNILASKNGFCWEVQITALKNKFLSPLVILAENLIDANLYQKAAHHHQIDQKLEGVAINSSVRGGGGSQIPNELRGLLVQGTPVFAITDGDFLFPGMSSSIISNRCIAIIAEQHGVGWHFSLPVREIENIIPLEILRTVVDGKKSDDAYQSIKDLAAISKQIGNYPSDFTCQKSGLTLSKVFKSENLTERAYLIKVAEALQPYRVKEFGACIKRGSCAENTCACFISQGFGENVLKSVNEWISEKSSHESFQSFSKSKVWMSIGEMIFDASIAFKPIKV